MGAIAAVGLVCAATAIAAADDAADLDAIVKAAPHCDPARAHCFALRLHVARTEDGGAVVEPAWIAAQIAMANHHFEPIETSFQVAGVDFLPADAARVEDRAERSAFASRTGGTVIDVFFTGYLADVDKPGAFIRGVTWHIGEERRLIILSAVAPERTLAHELGHFFGLPHSKYAISIMNKTPRDEPPPEERRFSDEEIVKLKAQLPRLVRAKLIAPVAPIAD
ncbi:hypothetical protein BH11MYX3_BH11MYX3_24540 [soil metagenome]